MTVIHEEVWENDPWRVLATCIMLTCTTEAKARPIVEEFFKRWPTAKSCRLGNIEEQVKLLAPLGMYSVKAERIRQMSKTYMSWFIIAAGTADAFEVEKCLGCGKYAREAWNLIVRKKLDSKFANQYFERRRQELIGHVD